MREWNRVKEDFWGDLKRETAWVSQRRIPFVKCGRLTKFDLKAIDKWIDKNTVNGAGLSKYRT